MEMNKNHFTQALEEADNKHAAELAQTKAQADERDDAVRKAEGAVQAAKAEKEAAEAALKVTPCPAQARGAGPGGRRAEWFDSECGKGAAAELYGYVANI